MNVKIKEALKYRGMSQVEFADKTGFSTVYISDLLRGAKGGDSTKIGVLKNIAHVLNVPIGYFFGECEISPELAINKTFESDEVQYIKVPLFESKAAATPDILDIAKDEQKSEILVRADEIKHKGTIHAFQVRGDSMEKEIKDGDYVAIQINGPIDAKMLESDAIYLCQITDDITGDYGLTLKMVTVAGTGIVLTSYNASYKPRYIEMRGKMLSEVVKGKVIRSWRNW